MKKLLKSFGYAIRGLLFVLGEEQNMKIHLACVAIVTIAGIYFDLSALEWSAIALTIGLVVVTEMMNTAIEMLVDLVSPEHNEKAGRIKDIAAGGVLVSAIIAVVVGVYIFGNKFFNLLL